MKNHRTSIVMFAGTVIALALFVLGATRGPARAAHVRPALHDTPAAGTVSRVHPSRTAHAAVAS